MDEKSHQAWVVSHRSADWSTLPPELSYVIAPCMKHAIRVCLGEPMPIALTDEDMHELKECAEKIHRMQHNPLLSKWSTVGRAAWKQGQRKTPAQSMVASLLEMLDEFRFPLD